MAKGECGWGDVFGLVLLRGPATGVAGDIIKDALHEDDADVDALGDVGGETDGDALDGSDAVGLDAGDVEVAEFGGDGIGGERGIVRHGAAVVMLRDEGATDGIEDSPLHAGLRHAVVAWVLMHEGGDDEDSKELAGDILREADASGFGEALQSGAIGGVRIGCDGDGGDAGDGGEVGEVGDVVQAEIALLLPGEGNDNLGGEKLLVGVDELGAWLWKSRYLVGFEADESN